MSRIIYPELNIRSKNELAKRLASKSLPANNVLELINDVIKNRDGYWRDSNKSDPQKGKWVRDAKGTRYGFLLKLIDAKILAKYDSNLPPHIYGGISGKNCKKAAANLLGRRRKRTLLKMDLSKFYEQTTCERVYSFFRNKCKCSKKAARLLAILCCIQEGPKGSKVGKMVLARGFSTSSRLAVWCNIEFFERVSWIARKKLRGYDPKVSIYIDDIGITASRVPAALMYGLKDKIIELASAYSNGSSLILNEKKTKVVNYMGQALGCNGEKVGKEYYEFLGIKLKRNGLDLGHKTQGKRQALRDKRIRNKGIETYKRYITSKT